MRIIITVALFFISCSTFADAFEDDLRTLFELTGVKNNYAGLNNVILNQMQAGFFQAADQNIESSSLSEEQRQQVGDILKARFADMAKNYQNFVAENMSYEQVEREIYIPLYKDAYSHEEIKELLNFYSSPTGKKTIEFSQKISEQATKKSAEKYDEIIAEYVKSQINENISLVKKEVKDKGIE